MTMKQKHDEDIKSIAVIGNYLPRHGWVHRKIEAGRGIKIALKHF